MIEVERKFRLTPIRRQEIVRHLEKQHGPLHAVQQIDKIFLHGIDSFQLFKPGMSVMRIRTEDSHTQLTYKKAINGDGDSIEHELGIASAETMESVLLELGFKMATCVVKRRAEVRTKQFSIAIDNVEGLGEYLEVEKLVSSTDEVDHAVQDIMQYALQLGLGVDDIEDKKYDRLIAVKNNTY